MLCTYSAMPATQIPHTSRNTIRKRTHPLDICCLQAIGLQPRIPQAINPQAINPQAINPQVIIPQTISYILVPSEATLRPICRSLVLTGMFEYLSV